MQTPSWVTDLRAQAPVTAACTYLDCAYDCGGTTFAAAAAQAYFADWARAAAAIERGGPGRETFFRLADETRAQICALIGAADPRGVCFTRNTNEGISHILMGFDDFRPGDNILVCDIEHPSVLMPCLNAQKLRGVEARVLPPVDGEYLPAELFMGACDDHTRMILLSHVQSSNGCKADLAALGAFCRQRGIYLVVDAIQSLGFSVFEAERWGVSAVSAGGYKGLLAGESSAFLWCAPDLLSHIWPTYTAAGPAMTVDRMRDAPALVCRDPQSARKLENSSLDAPGIYMLHAGISRVLDIGPAAIEAHIRGLYERLWDGLLALGITPVTPREPGGSCAAIAFTLPGAAAFYDAMRARGIIFTSSRLLRLSIAPFTTRDEIDRALAAARAALGK
ncbi:MAG: aminotransferase class V-fold PLP-dependent enzyme [Clostridia bacterium]|nr:aminotransferase class V-fold PLP-dependent enzyme [Clostridia bacterium]